MKFWLEWKAVGEPWDNKFFSPEAVGIKNGRV